MEPPRDTVSVNEKRFNAGFDTVISLEPSHVVSFFDFRLIVRGFWRRPGFAIAATFPLALAMGANTTLFRVTDEFVLQPAL